MMNRETTPSDENESTDESTYTGPDDDLASGNITDADFAPKDDGEPAPADD